MTTPLRTPYAPDPGYPDVEPQSYQQHLRTHAEKAKDRMTKDSRDSAYKVYDTYFERKSAFYPASAIPPDPDASRDSQAFTGLGNLMLGNGPDSEPQGNQRLSVHETISFGAGSGEVTKTERGMRGAAPPVRPIIGLPSHPAQQSHLPTRAAGPPTAGANVSFAPDPRIIGVSIPSPPSAHAHPRQSPPPNYASPQQAQHPAPFAAPPPPSPITPYHLLGQIREQQTVNFDEKDPMSRPVERRARDQVAAAGEGRDFWKRFSTVVHHEEKARRLPNGGQSWWTKKNERGYARLRWWVWLLAIICLGAIAGGLAYHFTRPGTNTDDGPKVLSGQNEGNTRNASSASPSLIVMAGVTYTGAYTRPSNAARALALDDVPASPIVTPAARMVRHPRPQGHH